VATTAAKATHTLVNADVTTARTELVDLELAAEQAKAVSAVAAVRERDVARREAAVTMREAAAIAAEADVARRRAAGLDDVAAAAAAATAAQLIVADAAANRDAAAEAREHKLATREAALNTRERALSGIGDDVAAAQRAVTQREAAAAARDHELSAAAADAHDDVSKREAAAARAMKSVRRRTAELQKLGDAVEARVAAVAVVERRAAAQAAHLQRGERRLNQCLGVFVSDVIIVDDEGDVSNEAEQRSDGRGKTSDGIDRLPMPSLASTARLLLGDDADTLVNGGSLLDVDAALGPDHESRRTLMTSASTTSWSGASNRREADADAAMDARFIDIANIRNVEL
jgi:hypothetical protein